jgi:hypothetical protein
MSTEDRELLANDWNNLVKAKRTGSSVLVGWAEAVSLDALGVLGAGLAPVLLLIRALDERGELLLVRSSRGT